MHDRGANQLLRQIPLTVSPFIHIPIAVTLPYSYQSLPRGLPQSSTEAPPLPNVTVEAQRPKGFIKSPSGHITTSPADIAANCHELIQHLNHQKMAAEQNLSEWERSIQERDLMEKRKVAPGYLDTGLRILEPTRRSPRNPNANACEAMGDECEDKDTGYELDRVFGKGN
ncbi:hypothetical protein EDC01DRAFT_254293 [Geopyxis carbonaria]|nr:hypothetical protein EDC01DRAFT_254293 [Geopyxis carbonaria]